MIKFIRDSQRVPKVTLSDITEIQDDRVITVGFGQTGCLPVQFSLGISCDKGFACLYEHAQHRHTEQAGLLGTGRAENKGVRVFAVNISLSGVRDERKSCRRIMIIAQTDIGAAVLDLTRRSPASFLVRFHITFISVVFQFGASFLSAYAKPILFLTFCSVLLI